MHNELCIQTNICSSLFTSGDYSDLTVIAGKKYRLHRNLVCDRSRPLEAACKYNRASKLDEPDKHATEDTLDLTDNNPHAIDCMLQYFYLLDYDLSQPIESDNIDGTHPAPPLILVLHAQIYTVAEKYMVDGLKALAMEKFTQATANHWDANDFLEAAREAYTSTIDSDKGLRDIIVKVFYTHQRSLLDKEEAVQLLIDVPLLAVHLLKYPLRQSRTTFGAFK
jgi:BTB/POZ domain